MQIVICLNKRCQQRHQVWLSGVNCATKSDLEVSMTQPSFALTVSTTCLNHDSAVSSAIWKAYISANFLFLRKHLRVWIGGLGRGICLMKKNRVRNLVRLSLWGKVYAVLSAFSNFSPSSLQLWIWTLNVHSCRIIFFLQFWVFVYFVNAAPQKWHTVLPSPVATHLGTDKVGDGSIYLRVDRPTELLQLN
jgi:hypothetical protein